MSNVVAIVMGSESDYEIMKYSARILNSFLVDTVMQVISAHRTPDMMFNFAERAESDGIEVIIAGAGGAAHLPGMVASKTMLPVIGVPIPSTILGGMDSLLSIVQMPVGVPVATMAIGEPGAKNAALFAAAILARKYPYVRDSILKYRNSWRP